MDLSPGTRLRSQVDDTEVIVVSSPSAALTLMCGGVEFVAFGAQTTDGRGPAAGFDTGNQLGKRYTLATDNSLEVLVTRSGSGTLTAGSTPLVLKQTKALPASD
jgi:hypothetical protein